MVLLRREQLQRLLLGNLDVHAHAVGIAAGLVKQLLRAAGNALQVDVAVEAVDGPQVAGNSREALHRVVGIAHHAAAEEQALDVVAAVELHRNLLQLRDRERRPLDVVRAAVDAVGAVVHAVVGQHHLQQRDASPVVGKRVADAHSADRRAHHALLTLAHGAARRARHVVLRRLCEHPQLLHRLLCQHRAFTPLRAVPHASPCRDRPD